MDLDARLIAVYGTLVSLTAPLSAAPSREAARKAYLASRRSVSEALAMVWRLERERAAKALERSTFDAMFAAELEPVIAMFKKKEAGDDDR
jgi:hypothetical protein